MGHPAPPCSRGWDGTHGVGHTETLTHLEGAPHEGVAPLNGPAVSSGQRVQKPPLPGTFPGKRPQSW